jgi:hypothetical protein
MVVHINKLAVGVMGGDAGRLARSLAASASQ